MLYWCILLVIFLTVRTGLEGPGLTVAQKIWYCVATVGGQYIWARLQSFSAFRRWGDSEQVELLLQCLLSLTHFPSTLHSVPPALHQRWRWIVLSLILSLNFPQRSFPRRAWMLIQRIEGLYKAASFGNLLIFLYTGRYAFKHQRFLLLGFSWIQFTEILIIKGILFLNWKNRIIADNTLDSMDE